MVEHVQSFFFFVCYYAINNLSFHLPQESTSSKKAKTQDDEGSDKSKSEVDDEDGSSDEVQKIKKFYG